MKRFLILLCLVQLALLGCGHSLKDKVVGAWKIDTSSINDSNVPAAIKANPNYAAQKAAAFQKLGEGRLEFRADGTFTNTGLPGDKSGKWSLKEREIVLTDDAGRAGKSMSVDERASKIHLGPVDAASGDPGIDFIKA